MRIEALIESLQRDLHIQSQRIRQIAKCGDVIVVRTVSAYFLVRRRRDARLRAFVVQRMIRQAKKMLARRRHAAKPAMNRGPVEELLGQVRWKVRHSAE